MQAAPLLLALAAAAAPQPAKDAAQRSVLDFLSAAISWHRESAALVPDEAGEVVFSDANRQLGRQALALAFDAARGEAALQQAQAGDPARSDSQVAQAQAQVKSLQAEIDGLNRRLVDARGNQRTAIARRLEETRSELDLAQVRQQTVSALADFAGKTGTGGLPAKIDELQRSVPEATPSDAPAPRRGSADPGRKAAPSGLLPLASEVIGLQGKLGQLKRAAASTARLAAEVGRRRTPLIEDLRATLQRGDELAKAADVAEPSALPRRARGIDDLTAHFKKVSAALVPLGKMGIVLDSFRANLDEWRASVDSAYDGVLRTLLLHLGLLVLAVGSILGASEFWRRATFRYFRDARRRQQSLLVRRVVVALALLLIVTFSLVTEFGSIATFAGFITAGLAVALQNVILSIAAYFFLIGRSGIRVGDRVQIGGVTGDVMDVGLVRLHLMEVEGDGLPTGRVTIFSNAVLFQPSANFFKQMPGSNFAWHHVMLTLSPETDYRTAEKRLLDAVSGVFAEYQGRIVRQHEEMSENLSIAIHRPAPQSTLRLTDDGLEMTIRYPVPLESASAIDDKMTRALLDALEREPRLRLIGSPSASIQPSPEPEHSAH